MPRNNTKGIAAIKIVDLTASINLRSSNLNKKYNGRVNNIVSLFKIPKIRAIKYNLSFLHNIA